MAVENDATENGLTLEQLTDRATAGLELDRERMLRPSLLYHLVENPFWVWCHHHAPKAEAVDEESEYDKLAMGRGVEFERKWVEANYPQAVTPSPAWGREGMIATLQLMRQGVPAIWQPVLWSLEEGLYGKADLLVRVDNAPSSFGSYSWKVLEIKNAVDTKKYHCAQACAYSLIVAVLQGELPAEFEIVLPSGTQAFKTLDHIPALREAVDSWQKIRDGVLVPDPPGYDKTGTPWRKFANKTLLDRKDLTLLGDVGRATREKLRRRLGVTSIPDLGRFSEQELTEAIGAKTGRSTFFNVQAYALNKPVVPPGQTVSIPWTRRNFHLDFETTDWTGPEIAQPQHAYLTGLLSHETGKFDQFLARGAKDETEMFRAMLKVIGELEDATIFMWSPYERTVIEQARGRCPEIAPSLDRLLTRLVDLKDCLKPQVFIPTATWSIKLVAPFVGQGYKWRHSDANAFTSMVAYWKFLAGQETEDWRKALDYHRDDCFAMAHIARALDGLKG